MVKIGFIVEGDSEEIILKSEQFRSFLDQRKINYVDVIANARGGGNLLPHRLSEFTNILKDEGATHFIILTDLENDQSIREVKQRINAPEDHLIVISVKALEAWYLADGITLSSIFKKNYHFEFPEQTTEMPFDTLRNEFVTQTGRGINKSKPGLARRMINSGFSIEKAAEHLNCPSARYFLDKLKTISLTNQ